MATLNNQRVNHEVPLKGQVYAVHSFASDPLGRAVTSQRLPQIPR